MSSYVLETVTYALLVVGGTVSCLAVLTVLQRREERSYWEMVYHRYRGAHMAGARPSPDFMTFLQERELLPGGADLSEKQLQIEVANMVMRDQGLRWLEPEDGKRLEHVEIETKQFGRVKALLWPSPIRPLEGFWNEKFFCVTCGKELVRKPCLQKKCSERRIKFYVMFLLNPNFDTCMRAILREEVA